MLFGLLAFCGIIGSDEAGGASPTTRRSLFVFIRNFVGGLWGVSAIVRCSSFLHLPDSFRMTGLCPVSQPGELQSYERVLSSRFRDCDITGQLSNAGCVCDHVAQLASMHSCIL